MAIMRSQFKEERGKFFLFHRDLNHGPLELKASVLPMSYTVVNIIFILFDVQYA